MVYDARKVLVTGGSGFIGTNLVESLLGAGTTVLSIDLKKPHKKDHEKVFRTVDILDRDSLMATFSDFLPTHVVHLAARTDLHETQNLSGYDANIEGVRNMIIATSHHSSVRRCIFASTKLVCPTDHIVTSTDEYCPDTLYGRSKALGEQIIKNSVAMTCTWCIVRPTSIWGPWCYVPYGRFFGMIKKGLYFHPGNIHPPKSFGYVGNTVFQIERLLVADDSQIARKVFYLSDYESFVIKDWADTISLKWTNRPVRTIPCSVTRVLARCGDLLKRCGIKEPLFSSFRLRNMWADTTGIPLDPIKQIAYPLPYSMEQGVEETIAWIENQRKS